MKEGYGKAYGKIIISGEHSVVYGYRAIAIPFRAVEVSIILTPIKTASRITCQLYDGVLAEMPQELLAIRKLIEKMQADFSIDNHDTHYDIQIHSTIPPGRGMGSSAAVSKACVDAFCQFHQLNMSLDQMLEYIDYAEEINHGKASGLDARLAIFQEPITLTDRQDLTPFDFDTPYSLLIVDTGVPSQTHLTVKQIQNAFSSPYRSRQVATSLALAQLGDATDKLYHALTEKSVHCLSHIKASFNASQRNLATLGVSTPELDIGIDTAIASGALAAKITGGGGGGCFIVLCENKQSAKQIAQVLINKEIGHKTWVMPFSSKRKDL